MLAVPSSAPQNLSPSIITSSSFMLRWNKLPLEYQNGNITGYEIEVMALAEHSTLWKLNTEASSILVSSVEESTTYNISVAARTSMGVGPHSEPIFITTKKDQCM